MSDEIDDGGPAFPVKHRGGEDFYPGMSLRAYFAGQALASSAGMQLSLRELAEWCVRQSDALIAELNK